MDKFWNFCYFLSAGIFITLTIKNICKVLIVKYTHKAEDAEDEKKMW